ncbi:hypothetical protein [Sorangium sp. So ce406]|uniref:hypothetical protein n=1 Tax=Sorangium sp. So ce406 TaxID=3133311 RepID=UPI003F5B3E7C
MTLSQRPARYVVEAIARDALFFRRLLEVGRHHPNRSLIFLGLVPTASMFIVESYGSLLPFAPELGQLLSQENLDLVRPARHRAKLLLSDRSQITDTAAELAKIATRQREAFLRPHTGPLRWLKRIVQADMGVFTFDGHVFSSTHAAIFSFGTDEELESIGHDFGYLLGKYISTLASGMRFEKPFDTGSATPPIAPVEMKDIKFESLYKRGPLGSLELGMAAACSIVLASVNMTHRMLRSIVDPTEPTFFKLRFLSAYHAQSSIQLLQDALRPAGKLSPAAATVFVEVLRHPFARWLRGRKELRDVLVHYQPRLPGRFDPTTTADTVVASLLGRRSMADVDQDLDTFLDHITLILSGGFALDRHTFWYGAVEPDKRAR